MMGRGRWEEEGIISKTAWLRCGGREGIWSVTYKLALAIYLYEDSITSRCSC